MTRAGPGRPRLTNPRRPGNTARAEILDAAAELFSTRGFATTTTRQIADAVGMRQASLYNHFATKNDILATLLDATIAPTVEFDEGLDDSTPAAVLLCALAWFDAAQLCAGRWNLGALYMLPEVRSESFETFRQSRLRLARRYRDLAVEVLGGGADAACDPRVELPFRLVESIIDIRADRQVDTAIDAQLPETLATAALTVLGQPTEDVMDQAWALMIGGDSDSFGTWGVR